MRFLTSIGFSSTSKPAMVAVPEVGGRKQVRTRIVVVLPAPLGPRKPTIWPFSTSKEMSSTATVRAYRLVRPSTLIILMFQTRQTWLLSLRRESGGRGNLHKFLNWNSKEGEGGNVLKIGGKKWGGGGGGGGGCRAGVG